MLRLEQSDVSGVPGIPLEQPRAESPTDPATIGKSLVIKGEIRGNESLYVDGKVQGVIHLLGNRVTIGPTGQVVANIFAREIVLLGKVQGNCHASERIDIHSGGSLTGDVITACISIEDGAFIRGIIDIPTSVEGFSPRDVMNSGIAQRGSLLAAIYDAQAEDEIANGQYEVPDDELDLEELLIRWRSGTPAHEHSRNTR